MAVVEFKDVSRIYRNGEHEQKALDHVDLTLEEGKFIVVLGQSGAGKSTLLNLLGGLDSPTEGTIVVDGKDISTRTGKSILRAEPWERILRKRVFLKRSRARSVVRQTELGMMV